MNQQEHQPLLPDSSTWPSQHSTPPLPIAQQQSSFASAAHSNSFQTYPPIQQSCGSHPTPPRAYPALLQKPLQQQQNGSYGPPPPNRLPSYGSSLHSRSVGSTDLYSSFDSMSLGSSLQGHVPAKRYNSAASTDSVDVLSQRTQSCSSVSTADQLLQSCYPPLPAQQQPAFPAPSQQQQHPARYPSIDSGNGSVSHARSSSLGRVGLSTSMTSRANSTTSTCSSGASKYPSVPGPFCNSSSCAVPGSASYMSLETASLPLQPHILDSWDDGPAVGTTTQQLDLQQQQQQAGQSVRGKLGLTQQFCGLYPVLSGVESPPQLQQHQQSPGSKAEVAPWGYDLRVYVQQVSGLSVVGHPYVMVLMHLGGHDVQYRTEPQWNTQQAVYGQDEVFDLCHVQPDCILRCEVWDKCLTEDGMLGRATWSVVQALSNDSEAAAADPQPALAAPTAAAGSVLSSAAAAAAAADGGDDVTASGDQDAAEPAAADLTLLLSHPTKTSKPAGQLHLKVVVRPSQQEGQPRMAGPVRFRQHLCPTVGVFTGHWSTEETMCYSTYKVFLCHISSVFDGVLMHWNPDYDKARMIFEPVLGMTPLVQVVRQQHSAMYATQAGTSRGGVLRTAGDFFKLFNFGLRGGESRFFTYVLCNDCFRCSETGTRFGIDIVSKHAMHAGGAEEVLYAGEFCIMRCEAAADGHKLVLDNNSGTYSPHKAKLALLQQLFKLNFPDMEVEVLDWRDPKLGYYHSVCPSRATATAAAAKAAAAAVAAATPTRGQQFVAG